MTVLRAYSVLAAALCMFVAAPAWAQDSDAEPRGTLSIVVENDKFRSIDQSKQTDRNFTNGIRLNWISEVRATPRWGRELASWIPLFPDGGTTRVGYALGQNMYTPENIVRRDLQRADPRHPRGGVHLDAAHAVPDNRALLRHDAKARNHDGLEDVQHG
jgi:hypothetical protein